MARLPVFQNVDPDTGPSLKDVAQLIKAERVKNIIVLVGAGISTSAGIPDFRSPDTGLYANLAKYDLPFPEAIFDLQYFTRRPQAFFTLAKELFPGNYLPTLTHYFFVLLHQKGLVKRVFTQNVDTLERIAGLPSDLIVEAHGSFATAHCLLCRQEYSATELRPRIAKGEVLRCQNKTCVTSPRALIKSDIIFFGEAMPERFFQRLKDFKTCDLLITIGTSLKVQPFASLIDRVDDNVPRLLVNLERVGEMDEYDGHAGGMFGSYREEGFDFSGATRGGKQNARDVAWIGEADKGVRELAEALGWEKELDELYDRSRAELEEQDLSILDTSETASPKASTSKKSTSPITNAATNKSKAIAGEIAGTFQQDETDESKADVAANESDGIDQLVADIRSMGVSEATEVSDKGTDIATLPNAKDESTAASDEATPGETPQPSPPTRSSPVDQIKQKLTHKF